MYGGRAGSSVQNPGGYSERSTWQRGESAEKNYRTCFTCGKSYHWNRDCPHKNDVCSYCGTRGHTDNSCYDKRDGIPPRDRSNLQPSVSFGKIGFSEDM